MATPLTPRIIADLEEHGPSTPTVIAGRLGQHHARHVWRICLRMANAGQITFDETGRTASLTPTPATDQEPTT